MKPVSILCLVLVLLTISACVPVASTAVPTTSAGASSGSENAAMQRFKALLYGADDVARLTTIAQLEADGSPEATALLGNFLLESTGTGRPEAAGALLRLDTDQSKAYIRTAMTDKALSTRRQAAMQALETNGEASYPFLKIMLRDTDETVRLNTVRVIQFIGTTQARTLLQIALRDSSPAVQSTAAEALQALGYQPTPTPTK